MNGFVIFIVFLCPLIFFHELGHFLFARIFGVRVETFSIGFGPKLFKFKKGATDYVVSIIPLGGYVKMFGDDPFQQTQLTEEEKKVAFNHKSKFARFWIVFGGPLANFLMAIFIYFFLIAGGETVPETRLGSIPQNTMFYDVGFRSGDRILEINHQKIISFDDLDITTSSINQVKVKRNESDLELNLNLETPQFISSLVGYLSSPLRKPLFVDKNLDYFLLYPVDGNFNDSLSLEEIVEAQHKIGLYKVEGDDLAQLKLSQEKTPIEVFNNFEDFFKQRSGQYKSLDLVIESIKMKSPADLSGIQGRDVVIKINDKEVMSFESMRNHIQDSEGELVLTVWRSGQEKLIKVTPEVSTDPSGKKLKTIGIYPTFQVIAQAMIETKPEGYVAAFTQSLQRTYLGFVKTFVGYKKLITREVSLENIGGPLAIGKVASDSFNISLSMFFRLMAMMSINLGLINLLPVPVLDGGHIMFLVIEFFNRGPISRRKMEIAQKFGLSFLFFLIFIALYNDISRII